MAVDIEAKSAIFDCPRQSAHIAGISFKNFRLVTVARELIAGRQTRWPSSDYDDATIVIGFRQQLRPRERFGTPESHRESRKGTKAAKNID